METKVVKAEEANIFMEDIIWWHNVMSILHAWIRLQTGAVDPGHANSHEVFYVVRGTVLLRCGDKLYELHEGMAQIIPPTQPHQLTNIGETKCIVSWSMAPGD